MVRLREPGWITLLTDIVDPHTWAAAKAVGCFTGSSAILQSVANEMVDQSWGFYH